MDDGSGLRYKRVLLKLSGEALAGVDFGSHGGQGVMGRQHGAILSQK